jgi:nicotinate-nucleotide--dimethylbenzimidazole phosphoribosyltransferase
MHEIMPSPDNDSRQLAEQRQAQLIKPRGALGRLEDLACWFAARQGCEIPQPLQPAIAVFAADHGVACRGVSAYPQSVTAAMLASLANGKAAIAVLARELQCTYEVLNVGVIGDVESLAGVHHKRIAHGTQDLSILPAMTPPRPGRRCRSAANKPAVCSTRRQSAHRR